MQLPSQIAAAALSTVVILGISMLNQLDIWVLDPEPGHRRLGLRRGGVQPGLRHPALVRQPDNPNPTRAIGLGDSR